MNALKTLAFLPRPSRAATLASSLLCAMVLGGCAVGTRFETGVRGGVNPLGFTANPYFSWENNGQITLPPASQPGVPHASQ